MSPASRSVDAAAGGQTLRARIVIAFVGFALAVAVIFGLSATVFVYSVEDAFFEATLNEEAAVLEQDAARTQRWGEPRPAGMTLHQTPATMPGDLRAQVTAAPDRREFRGDAGRHYHVRRLGLRSPTQAGTQAWLVAEVSSRLVVRPMRGTLLRKWLMVELAILLLAVVLALWLARRIAKPLSSFAAAIDHFDPQSPATLIPTAGADRELLTVARALEGMRTRVQAFVAREQAFSRDASHELRTPLSVVRSATAQVLNDPSLAGASRELIAVTLQSAEHMQRTVATLLALSRESTEWAPMEPVHIVPVLERVVLELSIAIDREDIALSIDVPPGATVNLSDTVLHLLLSNILGNAVAHAGPGVVRVEFAQRQLRVSNPMRPGDMPQVDALGTPGVRREDSPGLGFGLSLVRRLSERAGVTLRWRTHGENFEVTLGFGDESGSDSPESSRGPVPADRGAEANG